MSFFNDIEEDNQLEKQKSAAELKKEQYLEKVNSLKKLVKNIGTKEEIHRITAIGALTETTDFLNLKPTKPRKNDLDGVKKGRTFKSTKK